MKPLVGRSNWRCCCCWALVVLWLQVGICAAGDHLDDFEGDQTGWIAISDIQRARIISHGLTKDSRHAGASAEQIEIEALDAVVPLRLEYQLPPARLIDELKLTLWLQAPQDGVSVMLRAVLPKHLHLRTGKATTVLLEGEKYTKVGSWQKLTCDNPRLLLQRMLPQMRKRLQIETGESRQEIDTSGAYIDAAIVSINMGRGRSRFVIDDLEFGPIVEATSEPSIQRVAGEAAADPQPDAEFRMDRLHVGGQPFFPVMFPYHGERPVEMSKLRLNVAWVPDYQDTDLLNDLRQAGIRSMAVPPRPMAADGTLLDLESAHLTPFSKDTSPILFWYLGTRIPASAKRELVQWEEQIRRADRGMLRPIAGDVAGLERTYSKHLKMLGVTRPVLHTSFGFKNYRDWLIERRMQAQPGSFVFTWIHTDPSPATARQRTATGRSPLFVEPEQIRTQVYCALAAGCRAIGYWTHSSLEGTNPADVERRLILTELNMELDLLEPWIATATPMSQTPFTAKLPPGRNAKQLATPASLSKSTQERDARLNDRDNSLRQRDQLTRNLEAAILRTDRGVLVLPIWYADEEQFVPSLMAANDARIVVSGVGDASHAFEISPTKIEELQCPRVTGGKEVTLKKFDMTSVILFTDNPALVERLREKVTQLAPSSARVRIDLARAKLDRTIAVDRELREYGRGQPDAKDFFATARRLLDQAEAAWQRQQYHTARTHAADCMQITRHLQHACWSDAAHRMQTPVSSPHTLCFQTLPDHWDMLARLGRARHSGGKNLFRSGDFEDFDTLVAEGLKHMQTDIPGIRSAAELYPRPHQGKYCLRLIATPETGLDPPTVINERPVSVVTPPVTVYRGQLVYISGWVKIAAPSLCNLDGAVLYDSIGGPASALRWRSQSDWKKFELVREVSETTDLTLTIALSGLGEIRLDDLQIIPLETDGPAAEDEQTGTPATKPGKAGITDFLKKFQMFGGKPDAE